MIAVVVAKSGHVAFSVPRKADSQLRVVHQHCLPKVFEAWSACRPNNGTRGLLLHHNNTSAHTAVATLDSLETNRVQLVTQVPIYSGLNPL